MNTNRCLRAKNKREVERYKKNNRLLKDRVWLQKFKFMEKDGMLLSVIFIKCKFQKNKYILPSRKKLLELYNQESGRNVSISSIDIMINRLKEAELIIIRKHYRDNLFFGKLFTHKTCMITEKGLGALEMWGYV